jgi:hypothetical protein
MALGEFLLLLVGATVFAGAIAIVVAIAMRLITFS